MFVCSVSPTQSTLMSRSSIDYSYRMATATRQNCSKSAISMPISSDIAIFPSQRDNIDGISINNIISTSSRAKLRENSIRDEQQILTTSTVQFPNLNEAICYRKQSYANQHNDYITPSMVGNGSNVIIINNENIAKIDNKNNKRSNEDDYNNRNNAISNDTAPSYEQKVSLGHVRDIAHQQQCNNSDYNFNLDHKYPRLDFNSARIGDEDKPIFIQNIEYRNFKEFICRTFQQGVLLSSLLTKTKTKNFTEYITNCSKHYGFPYKTLYSKSSEGIQLYGCKLSKDKTGCQCDCGSRIKFKLKKGIISLVSAEWVHNHPLDRSYITSKVKNMLTLEEKIAIQEMTQKNATPAEIRSKLGIPIDKDVLYGVRKEFLNEKKPKGDNTFKKIQLSTALSPSTQEDSLAEQQTEKKQIHEQMRNCDFGQNKQILLQQQMIYNDNTPQKSDNITYDFIGNERSDHSTSTSTNTYFLDLNITADANLNMNSFGQIKSLSFASHGISINSESNSSRSSSNSKIEPHKLCLTQEDSANNGSAVSVLYESPSNSVSQRGSATEKSVGQDTVISANTNSHNSSLNNSGLLNTQDICLEQDRDSLGYCKIDFKLPDKITSPVQWSEQPTQNNFQAIDSSKINIKNININGPYELMPRNNLVCDRNTNEICNLECPLHYENTPAVFSCSPNVKKSIKADFNGLVHSCKVDNDYNGSLQSYTFTTATDNGLTPNDIKRQVTNSGSKIQSYNYIPEDKGSQNMVITNSNNLRDYSRILTSGQVQFPASSELIRDNCLKETLPYIQPRNFSFKTPMVNYQYIPHIRNAPFIMADQEVEAQKGQYYSGSLVNNNISDNYHFSRTNFSDTASENRQNIVNKNHSYTY